jgi:hypothetical protein
MKLNKLLKGEKGQALMIVVLLMLVSALVIAPVLAHVSTGLKTGKEVYEERMLLFYAADSGIEDGLWQIDNENLEEYEFYVTDPVYDPYAYYDYSDSYEWHYDLPEDVNDKDTTIAIQNIWIPKDIDAPDPDSARDIIEGEGGNPPGLIITGNVSALSTYQINIAYYYDSGEDPGGANLKVSTIGIWLPPGFDYVDDSCSLGIEPAEPEGYCSGLAVVWDFSATPLTDFPGSTGYPMERSFTFQFSGPEEASPGAALSWIDTSSVSSVDYAWDADVKVYKVASTATDAATGKNTTVEAYTAVSDIRDLGSATSGDYLAIGNSLIGGNGHWPDNYHYHLYRSTQSSISTDSDPTVGIPADANIEAAYLYWTGWIDWHGYDPEVIFYDDCYDFANPPVGWTPDSHWTVSSDDRFEGRGGYSSNNDIASGTIPLGDYSGQTTTLSLDISDSRAEDGDYLYYQFYKNGGWSSPQTIFEGDYSSGTYSVDIPEDYLTSNFRMMFTIDFNRTNEYVYLNNITIASGGLVYPLDPSAEQITGLVEHTARVNKVLFNDTLVTADAYQTLYPDQFVGNDTFEGTWFYTAMTDVTDLIDQWIEDELIESNGAGDYTLGHYYVGTNPSADNYRVNTADPSYSFDFYSGTGETGYPLGTPSPSSYPSSSRYTAAHCGWSLLIIYSSPGTKGHQLYLYDIQNPSFDFFFGWQNNADFDNDGNPGGTISGFLVPDPIGGETLAGRVTVFVGEGDAGYTDDYFRVNGSNMSNSSSPSNNVWNSASPGMTVAGVDIDPFDITWASGILSPGDTSVQIDIPTGTPPQDTDGFSMVYIILSFRSSITSGGTLSYLVRG